LAKVYGKTYTQEQLIRHFGSLSQICGVQLGQLDEGAERGVRTAGFRTGSGFVFTVLADRGMDIAWTAYRGASLDWRSPTTCTAPFYYESHGLGWLRGFHGGLLNCQLYQITNPVRASSISNRSLRSL